MYNFHETCDTIIEKGEKIAQLVVYELIQPVFEFSDEVTETSRGKKGFGSSDKIKTENSESSCDNTTTLNASYNKSSYKPPYCDDWYYRDVYNGGYARVPKLDQGDPDWVEIDPWKFDTIDDLLRYACNRSDISDDIFEEMVLKTIKNRKTKSSNV